MISVAVIAVIFLIVSFIFAAVNGEFRSASLWALWSIAAALVLGPFIGK